jgi:hypothetical protein
MSEKDAAADAENHRLRDVQSLISEQSRSGAGFAVRGMNMNKRFPSGSYFCRCQ